MTIVEGRIVQDFYTPTDYIAGRTTHEALDIVTNGSKPIYCSQNGRVVKLIDKYIESDTRGYGNEIWVIHDNGLTSRFAHNAKGNTLSEGDVVTEGQILAFTGRTGYRVPLSTYHTHYEVYENNKRIDPLKVDWSKKEEEKPMLKLEEDRELIYLKTSTMTEGEFYMLNHKKSERRLVKKGMELEVRALFVNFRRISKKSDLDGFKDMGVWQPKSFFRKHPELLEVK